MRMAGASSLATGSGSAMAMFLGTISPTTTCSVVTTNSATTSEMVCSTPEGTSTTASITGSIRWAMAGSAK